MSGLAFRLELALQRAPDLVFAPRDEESTSRDHG